MPTFIVDQIQEQMTIFNSANLCDLVEGLNENGRRMCNEIIYQQMKSGISVASQFTYNEMVIEKATYFLPPLANDPGYFEA